MGYLRVEGYSNLYRDENTGAIINKDDASYEQYINSRKNKLNNKMNQRLEIENLKSEVSEIKSLLMELINESRRNRTD